MFPFPMAAMVVPLIPPISHVGIGFSWEKSDLSGEQWLVALDSTWNSLSVTVERAHSSAVSGYMCVLNFEGWVVLSFHLTVQVGP